MRIQSFKYLVSFVLALWASALSAQAHWSCDINAYQYDMTVYYQLQKNGEQVTADALSNYEVAAFVGAECRGIGEILTTTVNEQTVYYGYLRVRSNTVSGETVSFKVYVKDTETEYSFGSGTDIAFVNNGVEGLPSEPRPLNISSFTVTLLDLPMGTLIGGGSFDKGAQATVKATPAAGYSFEKWSNDVTENPYTFTVESNVELSAIFTPIVYTITYNLSNGEVSESNPTEYTVESEAITLNNPTREDYTFQGWSGPDITDGTKEVTIPQGSTGNRVYTALWEATSYIINYDLGGGSLDVSNPESYTVNSNTFTLNEPTREGYDFAGWTGTDIDGTSPSVTIAKGSKGERTYTATWKPIEYTISYNLDGGELDAGDSNPKTYTIETSSFTLKNPKKEGLSFAGWTGTDLTEATKSVRITMGSTGNRSYTATWTDTPDVKLGDANGDDKIDTVDMSLLINKILGIEDPRFIDAAGDLNNDGKYDTVDLSLLINLILTQ